MTRWHACSPPLSTCCARSRRVCCAADYARRPQALGAGSAAWTGVLQAFPVGVCSHAARSRRAEEKQVRMQHPGVVTLTLRELCLRRAPLREPHGVGVHPH